MKYMTTADGLNFFADQYTCWEKDTVILKEEEVTQLETNPPWDKIKEVSVECDGLGIENTYSEIEFRVDNGYLILETGGEKWSRMDRIYLSECKFWLSPDGTHLLVDAN